MRRYVEILAKANDVKDVLAVESELARLRSEIDRVKSDIRWLGDRAARATIAVRFFAPGPSDEPVQAKRPGFFPGLRGVALWDARSESDHHTYWGGGVSLDFPSPNAMPPFSFVLDFDWARASGSSLPSGSRFAALASLGTDHYSAILGGGRRTFLNPFLGWRVGYASTSGKSDALLAGIVGTDLVRTGELRVRLDVRMHAFFFNPDGAHFGIEPTLGVNFSF